MPAETEVAPPAPLCWIAVTVKEELASTSVSSDITVPALFVASVTVLLVATESVSATPAGSSLIPITVIVKTAMSVSPCPSETV